MFIMLIFQEYPSFLNELIEYVESMFSVNLAQHSLIDKEQNWVSANSFIFNTFLVMATI